MEVLEEVSTPRYRKGGRKSGREGETERRIKRKKMKEEKKIKRRKRRSKRGRKRGVLWSGRRTVQADVQPGVLHGGSFAGAHLPAPRCERAIRAMDAKPTGTACKFLLPGAGARGRRGVEASDAALGPFDIQMRLRRLWTRAMSLFSLARGQPGKRRVALQDRRGVSKEIL